MRQGCARMTTAIAPCTPQELADYLVLRAGETWMHDMMCACQEITEEDVRALRSCGEALVQHRPEQGDPEAPAVPITVDDDDDAPEKLPAALLKALEQTLSIRDQGIIMDIASRLSPAERQEQIDLAARVTPQPKIRKLYNPQLLSDRRSIAADYDSYLRANYNWKEGGRYPYGAAVRFIKTLVVSSAACDENILRRRLRVWHAEWLKSRSRGSGRDAPRRNVSEAVATGRLKRARGAGRHRKCQWLHDELYEWWAGIRHSVDWEALKKGYAPESRPKALARFTKSMVKQKAKELLSDYCTAALKAGKHRPKVPTITSHWVKAWALNHGLSFRKPNRKYKVPKHVLEERLEKGWLNVFRVRAAVAALWEGHDPSIENWDQSPFHHNEAGSQNQPTLGLVNATCPLVEGHAATRARWTANLMTCSDVSRFADGTPPPCECMFKADGAKLKGRLQEHVRSRGLESWVSAATSEKGSYKMTDCMSYLDKHLPKLPDGPQSRPPRIIMADDHAPHLHPKIAEFCWSRGYVFIAHGGGVTPVAQTVDTDLNQEVKARYTALETKALLRKMRTEGKAVPHLRQEECLDLMTDVLKDLDLHRRAAEGYIKTGFTVPLDDPSRDADIVREAGAFWRDLHMREKVNSAVAEVREEIAAGRFRWCFDDVRRLIELMPRRGRVDEILDNVGDDTAIPLGEAPFAEDDGPGGSDEEDSESDAGKDDKDWQAEQAAVAADGGPSGDAMETLVPSLDKESSEALDFAHQNIRILSAVADELKNTGNVSLIAQIDTEIHKEQKKIRNLSKEDPEVLRAAAAIRTAAADRERKYRDSVRRANDEMKALQKVQREILDAQRKLKKQRTALQDAEAAVHIKHSARKYSLSDLGQGKRSCGGEACRRNRWDVLDRMSRLGKGLSEAQKTDFKWFKEAWDAKMMDEYKGAWPETFSSWMEKLLEDYEQRAAVAAFSQFVHSETCRCLAGQERVLEVPG